MKSHAVCDTNYDFEGIHHNLKNTMVCWNISSITDVLSGVETNYALGVTKLS